MRRRWLLATGGMTLLLLAGVAISRGMPGRTFNAKVDYNPPIWCCLEAGNSCRKVVSQDCIKEGGVFFNDNESVCSDMCRNLRELPKSDMSILSACACAPDGSAGCAINVPNAGPAIAPEVVVNMRVGPGISIDEASLMPAVLACSDPAFDNRWTASATKDPDAMGVSAVFQNVSPSCKASFFPVLSGRGEKQVSAAINGGLDPVLADNSVADFLERSCANMAAAPTGGVCDKRTILYVARVFLLGYSEAEFSLPIDECLNPETLGGIEPNGQCTVDIVNRKLRCPHLPLTDPFGALVAFTVRPKPASKICADGKAIRAQAEIFFQPTASLPGTKRSTAVVEHRYCLCTQNGVTCDVPKTSAASSSTSSALGAYCCLELESGMDCNANVSLQECEVARGTWSDSLAFCRQVCGFRGGSSTSASMSSSKNALPSASSAKTSSPPVVAMRQSTSASMRAVTVAAPLPPASSSAASLSRAPIPQPPSSSSSAGIIAVENLPVEATACSNGEDDDGDFLIDLQDPGCGEVLDADETDVSPVLDIPVSEPQVAGLALTLQSDVLKLPVQETPSSSMPSALTVPVMRASQAPPAPKAPLGRTGPETILIMVLGAAGGYAWIRRGNRR